MTEKLLTADNIFAANDCVFEDVAVPEWGGTVRVQAMNGAQRDAFEASLSRRGKDGKMQSDLTNVRAKLAARVCVNEKGTRLFTEDQVAKLGEKNAAALNRIFVVGQRLAGLSDDDVERLEGNSRGQSGDSASA